MPEHVIPSLNADQNAVSKSCKDCINFSLQAEPLCTFFSKPLFNSSYYDPFTEMVDQNKELEKSLELIGSSCGEYSTSPGNAKKFDPVKAYEPVFIPLPAQELEDGAYLKNAVNSCALCENFVKYGGRELGFGLNFADACSARGLVIAPKQATLASLAKDCNFRVRGETQRSSFELQLVANLFPVYDSKHLAKLIKESTKTSTWSPFARDYDPVTCETESPVTEEHAKNGVRAWRKVYDPSGNGNSIMIPVFRRDFFTESEREKIPSSDSDERPQDYIDHQGLIYRILVAWMALDETPALIGPAGTGKTEVCRTIAWMMQVPFERISITASTELDDIQGKMLFRDNETVFQYGRLTSAWQKPNVICLDEPNVGPPDVWQFIRPLTDNSKQLVVDANAGERIYRNKFCFLALAMNPAWDTKNIGTDLISDADSSRLLHIATELPSREVEEEIIKKRCELDGFNIPDIHLDMMFGVADDIRRMSNAGEISISWGIRSQIKTARLLKWFSVEEAYRMASADSLEPQARRMILDIVKSRSGDIAKRYQDELRRRGVTAAKANTEIVEDAAEDVRADARADMKGVPDVAPDTPPTPVPTDVRPKPRRSIKFPPPPPSKKR